MDVQVAARKKRVAEEKAEKKKKKAAEKEANRQAQPFDFSRDLNRGQVRSLLLLLFSQVKRLNTRKTDMHYQIFYPLSL